METLDIGQGFGWGLLVAAFLLGLRHGIDWDHLAAITDITASQDTPRRGLMLGTLYASGHALVVFLIGSVAIAAGRNLPAWIDAAMGRVVGVTLVLLGGYVVVALVRQRGEFRMRSRWMLLIGGLRRAYRALGETTRARVTHEHEHAAAAHHRPTAADITGRSHRVATHRHLHTHNDDPFADYGTGTSLGVGMLHGIGAETPSQVLVFLAAAKAGGVVGGVTVLFVFLAGLFTSNSFITIGSAYGFRAAGRRRALYTTLGAVTAAVSLVVGTLFLFGQDAALPAFFAV